MKSKILRKLCVYAVSASMMLPAAVPVAAAKAPVVSQVKDPFILHGLNYITAYLYEGDSLQLRSTVPSSKLNRISGSYRWVSNNPRTVCVSSNGRITAKKCTSSSIGKAIITLKKGNWEISKCMVMVKPRIQFSTRTRTAKKGTTLKIQVPDEPISVSCSSSKVTFDLDKNYIKIKCLKKGTATITLTVNKNGTYKDEYHTKKTYRFNVNVK